MPRRRSDRANEFVTLRICHRPRSLIERGEDGAGTNVVTGIGSEGFVAVEMGRKFVGAELKQSYFEQAARNLAAAEQEQTQDLFATA